VIGVLVMGIDDAMKVVVEHLSLCVVWCTVEKISVRDQQLAAIWQPLDAKPLTMRTLQAFTIRNRGSSRGTILNNVVYHSL